MRFCRTCGFDFAATASSQTGLPPAPAPAWPPSPRPTAASPAVAGRAPVPRRLAPLVISLAIFAGLWWFTEQGGGGAAGWTRSANFTTCAQWAGQMTQGQREAMAATILPILRRTVDTKASDGSDLVPAFVSAITATCRSPEVISYVAQSGQPYVVTAAAALAFTEGARFHP